MYIHVQCTICGCVLSTIHVYSRKRSSTSPCVCDIMLDQPLRTCNWKIRLQAYVTGRQDGSNYDGWLQGPNVEWGMLWFVKGWRFMVWVGCCHRLLGQGLAAGCCQGSISKDCSSGGIWCYGRSWSLCQMLSERLGYIRKPYILAYYQSRDGRDKFPVLSQHFFLRSLAKYT